jgi:hypothetical protein
MRARTVLESMAVRDRLVSWVPSEVRDSETFTLFISILCNYSDCVLQRIMLQ